MRNCNASVHSPEGFISPPGSRYQVLHEPRFDGSKLSVVEVGTRDLQESIESYAPYCDLNYMLSRLKLGDSSVFSARSPVYGDFSGMPDNPIDAINLVHSAQRRFDELSAEDKVSYNNDYRVWLASLVSGSDGLSNCTDSCRDSNVSVDVNVSGEDDKANES